MRHTTFGSLFALLLVRVTVTFDDTLPQSFLTLDLFRDDGTAIDNRRQLEMRSAGGSEILPLFEGLGTHYSYIYVGTPPQRVSVIVDTGSHHTAFPCSGCNCGKHMNPSFDPSNSNSSQILKCSGRRCFFQQSYSEGSSWHAYKVSDKLWMGGKEVKDLDAASSYSIDFQFGCQDSETGLFRTQHVDGIMGMSATDDTLSHQLVIQNITQTKIFAMCFSVGGGILTLGGVDQSIHTPNTVIQYAKLMKPKGWFTVKLLDISMRASPSSKFHLLGGLKKHFLSDPQYQKKTDLKISIKSDYPALNGKKGVIVDSGTTDTYLPIGIQNVFENLFRKMSDGVHFSSSTVVLTPSQFDALPVIIYTLQGLDGSPPIEIENHPFSYTENLGNGKYAFRIYLTETNGAILGANVMNNNNVIFDIDNRRIGFAPSTCQYNNSGMESRSRSSHLLHVSLPDSKNIEINTKTTMSNKILSFASELFGY